MLRQTVLVPGEVRAGRPIAPPSGALPTATHLLCSFQGTAFTDHDLLRTAHALGVLHIRRMVIRDVRLVAALDDRRRELVDEIDDWIRIEAPAHEDGLIVHTETLGSVIDRMASGWADANRTIDTGGSYDHHARKRWHRLAEMIDGYTELVTEVLGGRRRLPTRV